MEESYGKSLERKIVQDFEFGRKFFRPSINENDKGYTPAFAAHRVVCGTKQELIKFQQEKYHESPIHQKVFQNECHHLEDSLFLSTEEKESDGESNGESRGSVLFSKKSGLWFMEYCDVLSYLGR